MPRAIRIIKIDPVQQTFATIALEGGKNFSRPIARLIKARQLGWREICKIEEQRLMDQRPKAIGPGTEFFDAGPTPLIVAADAQATDAQPGWRILGGKATAGVSVLFGQGLGGGMVNCPVDTDWLARMIVWLTPEETVADEVS